MDVDSSNTDPKYWEKVLNQCGLSMNRGKHLKTLTKHGTENRDLVLVGGTAELTLREEANERAKSGKVRAPGCGPDREGNGEGRS